MGIVLTERCCTLAAEHPESPHTPRLSWRSRRSAGSGTGDLSVPAPTTTVEVNRIKKIKLQLYGRAGFELLRKMILLQ